jgi:FemAB-related protein (PEP-CTERM system-associated)
MALRLRSLDAASAPAWDAFVHAHADGTFFHLAAWSDVIERSFGHRVCFTLAEQDGAVAGVLPLAHVKTRLFGNTLISVPFCVYGGPLAADDETAATLAAEAERLMRQTGARAVEFRHREPTPSSAWTERSELYVTFRRPITASDETNMKAIPRKQRAMVRKGIQKGLVSVADHNISALHQVYAESVRNLGTPVFSRRYFRTLADTFRTRCDVVTVLHEDRPVASVLNFYFRDEVLPYYGGGKEEARQVAGNDFMYWEVMRRAAARGCRLFDFGRSKLGTGAFAFKRNWGFEPAPLHYRYRLQPGEAIPDNNPLNPKYRLFVAGWKHLPLPVANAIGPFIVRGLG